MHELLLRLLQISSNRNVAMKHLTPEKKHLTPKNDSRSEKCCDEAPDPQMRPPNEVEAIDEKDNPRGGGGD
jgi:hypothetical protein